MIVPLTAQAPTIFLPKGRDYKTDAGQWQDVAPSKRRQGAKGREIKIITDPHAHREKCVAVQIESIDPAELGTIIVGGNVMYTEDAVELAHRIIEERDANLADDQARFRAEAIKWKNYVANVQESKREYARRNHRTAAMPVRSYDPTKKVW